MKKVSSLNAVKSQRGLTLVELMIAMVLGLILVGGVTGVFLTAQQTYRVNDSLNRMQDGFRVGFQLLTRDLRNAGSSGCTNNGRVVNVLAGNIWWADWANSNFIAYDGGSVHPGIPFGAATGQRVEGTSAIQMMYSLSDGNEEINIDHQPNGASFRVRSGSGIRENDIIMVCDQTQSTIFQVTNLNSNPGHDNVIHNTGASVPGNCTIRLGFPGPTDLTSCGGATQGTLYKFSANATLSRFESVTWFVGNNGRSETGGRSLYRSWVERGALITEEVIEGVQDLQFEFLLLGSANFIDTGTVPANRWLDVVSTRVHLTVEAPHQNPQGGERLSRTLVHEVALRNPVL
ncbi:prepilin-type N-terminal cleavage/methylation domain-containing protein [Alkalimonas sp. MEB108]|uniref:Prepilin-type N-terminal cleavage/methylation domain-containing protein n=1 Tax=Alkalimonas cellulosilytica TaxID=3058395 RepID=A0ABU7J8P7_9GAMM|nr:prepilin-type N-terminal cleavage/methylation domain-containing protein [Alkalimonas sp. MEB108]MEE2002610.1 prepilin-type N-terminal cleavage/methylation domain-containing protein [Alkalimonas sp. MEB108]